MLTDFCTHKTLHREHVRHGRPGVDRDLQIGPGGRHSADAVARADAARHRGAGAQGSRQLCRAAEKGEAGSCSVTHGPWGEMFPFIRAWSSLQLDGVAEIVETAQHPIKPYTYSYSFTYLSTVGLVLNPFLTRNAFLRRWNKKKPNVGLRFPTREQGHQGLHPALPNSRQSAGCRGPWQTAGPTGGRRRAG